MTQNEVSIIKNAVLDCTEAYVDARLSVLDYVKTQIGVLSTSDVFLSINSVIILWPFCSMYSLVLASAIVFIQYLF